MMCIKTSKIMGIKTLLDKDQKALLPAINDNLLMRVLLLLKDYANHYADGFFDWCKIFGLLCKTRKKYRQVLQVLPVHDLKVHNLMKSIDFFHDTDFMFLYVAYYWALSEFWHEISNVKHGSCPIIVTLLSITVLRAEKCGVYRFNQNKVSKS